MKDQQQSPTATGEEPMIDARQASYALRLPYYWFSDRKMRAAKRIPHYVMGGLVRFRISDLEAWAGSAKSQPQAEGSE